jgi:hypothetical protein
LAAEPFLSFVESLERRLDVVEFCAYVMALGAVSTTGL